MSTSLISPTSSMQSVSCSDSNVSAPDASVDAKRTDGLWEVASASEQPQCEDLDVDSTHGDDDDQETDEWISVEEDDSIKYCQVKCATRIDNSSVVFLKLSAWLETRPTDLIYDGYDVSLDFAEAEASCAKASIPVKLLSAMSKCGPGEVVKFKMTVDESVKSAMTPFESKPDDVIIFECLIVGRTSPKALAPEAHDGSLMWQIETGPLPFCRCKPTAEVIIDYRMTLESGEVIRDTYADDQSQKVCVGDHKTLPGFDVALRQVGPGGVVRLALSPTMAFGEPWELEDAVKRRWKDTVVEDLTNAERQRFLDYRPEFEGKRIFVDKLKVVEAEDVLFPWEYTSEEEKRIAATRLAEKSKTCIHTQKYFAGLELAEMAAEMTQTGKDATTSDENLAFEIKMSSLNNALLCRVKREQWQDALVLSSTLLREESLPNFIRPKALYRRAIALLGIGNLVAARECLIEADQLSPGDPLIARATTQLIFKNEQRAQRIEAATNEGTERMANENQLPNSKPVEA